jgi:hypothetical protein
VDDQYPDAGSMAQGWILQVETTPFVVDVGAQNVEENGSLLLPISLQSSTVDVTNVVLVATAVEQEPAGLVSELVITNQLDAVRNLRIVLGANLPSSVYLSTNKNGKAKIRLRAQDTLNNYIFDRNFDLNVIYVNQTPAVKFDANTNWFQVNETVSGATTFAEVKFNINDPDSIVDRTNMLVSSEYAIVPNGTTL